MNDDHKTHASTPPTNAPVKDAAGKPVDVVERDLEDRAGKTRGIDETVTPSSIRTKEQEAEELQRATDEIERKVADGN